MEKFTLVHAVYFKSGEAKVGKCHVITKADELDNDNKHKRIKEMQEKNKVIYE